MEFAAEGPTAIPLWVNGHAFLTVCDAYFDVLNPLTGEAVHRVPLAGADEAQAAVAAAQLAQPIWAEMGLAARRICLGKLADGLENYAGHFAKLLIGETGFDEARAAVEVADAVAALRGAAVVVKPSPKAPSAAYALCELSARAEWPAGVLNLMQGDTQAIAGLCAAGIDRMVFVGNAALGAQIGAIAEAAGKVFELQAQ